MVAGDFNFPDIKWLDDGSNQVLNNETSSSAIFINLLEDESLSQNVYFPTFKKADGNMENTLDYL